MKVTIAVGVLLAALTGCNDTKTTKPSSSTAPANVEPTNTGVNVRDRSEATKTPVDQNENQTDIDITAGIRKRVVEAPLSTDAHNVKIITQDGKVTLRGPVKSDDEKKQIEAIAHDVAGAANVDSQLEVAQ